MTTAQWEKNEKATLKHNLRNYRWDKKNKLWMPKGWYTNQPVTRISKEEAQTSPIKAMQYHFYKSGRSLRHFKVAVKKSHDYWHTWQKIKREENPALYDFMDKFPIKGFPIQGGLWN